MAYFILSEINYKLLFFKFKTKLNFYIFTSNFIILEQVLVFNLNNIFTNSSIKIIWFMGGK